jgi:hypothetical protein
MFERYTEKARRVIFFARYEASVFGNPYIGPEFLLLGLVREDKYVVTRWLGEGVWAEVFREEIEKHLHKEPRISTAVDLPLTNESKRILAYAAEEAHRLAHPHIGTEHLFLGILRESNSYAAKMLVSRGVDINTVRETMAREAVPRPVLGAVARSIPRYPFAVYFALGRGAEPLEFDWPQRIPVVGEFLWLGEDRFGGYQVTKVEWTLDKDPGPPHPTKVVIYADEFSTGQQAEAI